METPSQPRPLPYGLCLLGVLVFLASLPWSLHLRAISPTTESATHFVRFNDHGTVYFTTLPQAALWYGLMGSGVLLFLVGAGLDSAASRREP